MHVMIDIIFCMYTDEIIILNLTDTIEIILVCCCL